MELARGPDTSDQIFSRRDTNVFVAEDAVARLERQVLDARIDKERAAFFLVGGQRQRGGISRVADDTAGQ
jgi:hypothetical protein